MLDFNIKVEDSRKPLPNFTKETAIEKIRLAEDAWNNQSPEKSPRLIVLIVFGATVIVLLTAAQR